MTSVDSPPCTELLQIAADEIQPDPLQPRKTFLDEELDRLAESIRVRGLLQPLRVRYNDKLGKWIIVIGESRFHAGKRIGMTHYPCIPMAGDGDDIDTLIDQLAENDIRSSIPPTEHARGLARVQGREEVVGAGDGRSDGHQPGGDLQVAQAADTANPGAEADRRRPYSPLGGL